MGKWGKGMSVLIPNLAGYNISVLDKVVLTNPLPENVGGLITVIKQFKVKEIWDTLDPEVFTKRMTYDEFLEELADVRIDVQRQKELAVGIYLNYYEFMDSGIQEVIGKEYKQAGLKKILAEKKIHRRHLVKGTILHTEDVAGKQFRISVLNPPEERISGTQSDISNNSAVIKLTYGARSILLCSNIMAEGEGMLVYEYADELKSDVMLVPDHGSGLASSEKFINTVRPEYAIVQYGYLRSRSFAEAELNRKLQKYYDKEI
ncbi:ComEC/Rec2 family competence protein, partial [Elusimicrobiota bacterium]